MGIEKLIPKNMQPGTWRLPTSWSLGLLQKKYHYTKEEKIIIDEAIEYGLTTPIPPGPQGDLLFGTVSKYKDGVAIVAVSKLWAPTDNNIPDASFMTFPANFLGLDDIPEFRMMGEIPVRLCHLLLIAPNNPLELHWRQRWGDPPVISIEGLERIKGKKVGDATRYTKEICERMTTLDLLIKTKLGRPEGPAVSKDEFAQMKRDYLFYRSQGDSLEIITGKLGLKDVSTLYDYTKSWGVSTKKPKN